MAESNSPSSGTPLDPTELTRTLAEIALRSKRLVEAWHAQQRSDGSADSGDELGVGKAFSQLAIQLTTDPFRVAEASMRMWQDYVALWQSTLRKAMGENPPPVVEPASADNRFRSELWQNNLVFDYIKQSYLIAAQSIQDLVGTVEGLDGQTARKVKFFTRQYVDALAPTNFAMTNPEVLKATMESGGRNLLEGLNHLLQDLDRGQGKLAISMTDYKAFRLGENVATTPGKVVFQNDLMQLIQYAPTTQTVQRTPLLIVPPWINKYYILDLREKNSFIRFALDQGITVFVVSWVNPDKALAHKGFDDYMLEGPLAALGAMEQATGEKTCNLVGYCLGGTLSAATLAWMAQKDDARVKSATFLTTLIDFSEPGELGVFVDEESVASLEKKMAERGYLEGSEMAATFNMLRANDLIWSFVVNNYLLGKEPFPFDLLYWNSDATRMPPKMHTYYLRNMYIRNGLRQPGCLALAGVPIDLSKVRVPAYFVSTVEDHIAPWKTTYLGAQLLKGPVRFVLGGSGHIAGIVNPPAAGKYWYWTNDALHDTAEQWLQTASKQPGSWWADWARWVAASGGGQVPARQPGDGGLPVIEDAPGSYARLRLDQPTAGRARKPAPAPENRSRKKPAAVRPLRRSSGN